MVLLGPRIDQAVVMLFGVVPARFGFEGGRLVSAQGAAAAWSLVTYTFLHGGWLHVGVNAVWLLALGSGVARRLGAARFLGFYFLCGALAGLTYVAVQPGSAVPAIGASGAVSGLLGAVIRFIGAGRAAPGHRLLPLGDRRVLILVILWFVVNIAFGRTGLAGLTGGQPIAWEAHIGGFAAGLILFGLFDRRPLGGRAPAGDPDRGIGAR
jgi:membrane associated rhomboid family serine protease